MVQEERLGRARIGGAPELEEHAAVAYTNIKLFGLYQHCRIDANTHTSLTFAAVKHVALARILERTGRAKSCLGRKNTAHYHIIK